jgi:Zn-dependent peptidase ImmA (M78 family)
MIVIRSGMRAVHDRCALAHELAHAALGHRDDRPKHEMQADFLAAHNLIDLDKCREAIKWAPDVGRLATELDVSTRLLMAFLHHNKMAS